MTRWQDFVTRLTGTLRWLQNGDGGWGESKTQASRITNTCEAVWALANADCDRTYLAAPIALIKKGVRGENPDTDILNCEHPRDFAWAIIALTAADSHDEEDVKAFVKSVSHQTLSFDFIGGRGDASSSSIFNTAIVLIGLKALCSPSIMDTLSKATSGLVVSLANSLGDWLFSEIEDGFPINSLGEVSYAIYALALQRRRHHETVLVQHLNQLKAHTAVTSALVSSSSMSSRPDSRPYRHMSVAWLCMAAAELDHPSDELPVQLLAAHQQGGRGGWSMENRYNGETYTWTTALAFIAIKKYCEVFDQFSRLLAISRKKPASAALSPTVATRNKLFIVHGHESTAVLKLKDYITSRLKKVPVVLKDEPSFNKESLYQKLVRLIGECYGGIVLLTRDDLVDKNGSTYLQARPNVIFEWGFLTALDSFEILTIRQAGVNLPSDMDGMMRLEFASDISETFDEINRELGSRPST